jgi:hypothetical protein
LQVRFQAGAGEFRGSGFDFGRVEVIFGGRGLNSGRVNVNFGVCEIGSGRGKGIRVG